MCMCVCVSVYVAADVSAHAYVYVRMYVLCVVVVVPVSRASHSRVQRLGSIDPTPSRSHTCKQRETCDTDTYVERGGDGEVGGGGGVGHEGERRSAYSIDSDRSVTDVYHHAMMQHAVVQSP